MDIREFLTARLLEDENGAKAAAEEFGPDWVEIWSGTVALDGNQPGRVAKGRSGWDAHLDTADSGISRHIVSWDPTRVLAEVTAKRRRLVLHVRDQVTVGVCWHCNERCPCIDLRLDAAPYADHPDYDPAWRIDQET